MGVFVNLKTDDRLPLSDAVEAGLVTAAYENGQDSTTSSGGTETKTYAVNSVVDQVRVRPVARPGHSHTDQCCMGVVNGTTVRALVLGRFGQKIEKKRFERYGQKRIITKTIKGVML